jgi:hypothetical protein
LIANFVPISARGNKQTVDGSDIVRILRFVEGLDLLDLLARLEIDDIDRVTAKAGREQALARQIDARVIDPPVNGERDPTDEFQYRRSFRLWRRLAHTQTGQNEQLQRGGVCEADSHVVPPVKFSGSVSGEYENLLKSQKMNCRSV